MDPGLRAHTRAMGSISDGPHGLGSKACALGVGLRFRVEDFVFGV